MNAIATISASQAPHPLAAAVMNAVRAAEHANTFCGRNDCGSEDIEAYALAYDAKQMMLTQFRAIGLDEQWLCKLGTVL